MPELLSTSMCPSSHTRRPPPSYIFSQMDGRTRHDSDFRQHRDRGLFNHAHSAHAGVGIHTSVGPRTNLWQRGASTSRHNHRSWLIVTRLKVWIAEFSAPDFSVPDIFLSSHQLCTERRQQQALFAFLLLCCVRWHPRLFRFLAVDIRQQRCRIRVKDGMGSVVFVGVTTGRAQQVDQNSDRSMWRLPSCGSRPKPPFVWRSEVA